MIERLAEFIRRRRHVDAMMVASELVVRQPQNRDLRCLQALNLRLMGRDGEALAVLEELERWHPAYSGLHLERGHCHLAAGNPAQAIQAFQRAVSLNSALPRAWEMLRNLYRLSGDGPGASMAERHLAALNALPVEVVQANSLFADGELSRARGVIRAYLDRDGDNVGALRLLARICLEDNELQQAGQLLERVLALAPDYYAARLDYAMVLLRLGRYLRSRQEARVLLEHEPDNREYLKQYAAACIGLGDHEPVIEIYQRLLTGMPSGPEAADLRLWRANALKIAGRRQEAIQDYRAVLGGRSDSGAAWFGLANLKVYRFAEDEIARMRELESRSATADMDRCYLCFALGKALEDRGDYIASWRYYERGNALKRVGERYRPEAAEEDARRLQRRYGAEFFGARTGWGAADPAPIFIVGMPRSGSTLIEQILASHSAVEGTDELAEIGQYAAQVGALERLTRAEALELGSRYLADTRVHRRLGRPVFVDKMPNNFWHIGLIHLILPNARIIDARRDPMGCCFGNFKQLFGAGGQPFSYGIDDIARYYRSYLEVMRHWREALPGRVLTVQHEDVVADLEGSVRGVLDFCGLPFEPDCLEFHRTARSVRSASSEQVREPINGEGLMRWKHYEPWLGTLRAALGDALTTYRD